MAKKKETFSVNFILDETASMHSCKDQTVSGFNEYIKTLKKEKSVNTKMTLTRFNSDKVDTVYTNKKISEVKDLDDFNPGGMTPLYDAVGQTITKVEEKIKGKKTKVLFVILTDGEENCSKEYTREKIFDIVKAKKKEGWAFAFLGADQDAYNEGAKFGMVRGSTMNFDSNNMKAAMRSAGGATMQFASGGVSANNLFKKNKKD